MPQLSGECADKRPAVWPKWTQPTVWDADTGVVNPTAVARRLHHTTLPSGNPAHVAGVEPWLWQQKGLFRDDNCKPDRTGTRHFARGRVTHTHTAVQYK